MKKGGIIAGTLALTALGGYGAWCAYKKMNPNAARELKRDVKKVTKNMEKSIEDMM